MNLEAITVQNVSEVRSCLAYVKVVCPLQVVLLLHTLTKSVPLLNLIAFYMRVLALLIPLIPR